MPHHHRFPLFITALLLLVGPLHGARASILLPGGGTYTQNFNTLPAATTADGDPWVNDVTLPGWYAELGNQSHERAGTIRAGNGANDHGRLWSFGPTGSSDRSLGGIASGSVGAVAFGVQFQNTSGQVLTFDSLSFWAEEWRSNPGLAATLDLYYQVSTTEITSLLPVSGWTALSDLTFTAPVSGSTSAIDGKATGNREFLSADHLSLSLNPGEYILFRWVNGTTATGRQFGLAIDDFEISYRTVPEAGANGLLLLGLGGFAFLRLYRRRVTSRR
ncbi:MAG TPA: hypothetical protein VNQ90_01065 [Chthoniobacteraceae bacterium]|nr:hypothetical protein [Chthoniobacteraceae bacterium]